MKNRPARQVFAAVIAEVATSSANPPVLRARDGLVRISTQDEFDRRTVMRVYDIRDLMFGWSYEFENKAPRFEVSTALSNTNSGGGGGGSSGSRSIFGPATVCTFGDEAPREKNPVAQRIADQCDSISRMVEDLIGRPEEWTSAGGTVSSSRAFDGLLVVRTTPENHRAVERLLYSLRHPTR
jgi:hypothetical protein